MTDTPDLPDPITATENEDIPTISRVTVRRRLPAIQVDWRTLLIVILLVAVALSALLITPQVLPVAVQRGWPLPILMIAVIWLLRSLARRTPAGLLGSTALIGISVSLLLAAAYQVPLGETLIGVVLIAIGMGIVIRGLLWRTPTPRQVSRTTRSRRAS